MTKISNGLTCIGCLSVLVLLSACGGGGGGGDNSNTVGTASHTISGTITAAAASRVDSDVNDRNITVFTSNNIPEDAQDIPDPATVGGFVNQPFTGDPLGSLYTTGDVVDFYRVTLLADDAVALSVADHPAADLDLFLYEAADTTNPIDSSEGPNGFESVLAPSDGVYFIEVRAIDRASNYTLSVGGSAATATVGGDTDFVPGEVILRFRDQTDAAVLRTGEQRAADLGLTPKGRVGRAMLMRLGGPEQRARTLQALGLRAVPQSPGSDAAGASRELKRETLRIVEALRRRPDVLYAEPNFIRKPLLQPNDQFYPLQWHYPLINLPQAWDVTIGTSDVIVAVVDTGVLLGHPDFAGKLVGGYDFISDDANAGDGEPGIDGNPDDPGDGANPDGSSSFHGTHVAGTVGAATFNAAGVAGVGGLTRIMPMRALGTLGGTDVDIAQAVRYAAGLDNVSGTTPPRPADVINMSLGAPTFSQTLCDAVLAARNAGAIVVASAGNGGNSLPVYPAACPGVVSVSAVTIDKQLAGFSSFGSTIDVAAPGGSFVDSDQNGDGFPDWVLSTAGTDSTGTIQFGYSFAAGTSMAAPHVAGVAALMEAAAAPTGDDITPEEFDELLRNGELTEDLGDPGRDDLFGYGLIDALKAVVAAQATPSADPILSVSPSSVNFGTSGSTAELLVSNAGGGSLTVDSVTIEPASAGAWLTIAPDTPVGDGLGTYVLTVDRAAVPDGTYSAEIVVDATTASARVPVSMQKLSGAAADDAGRQYVLLIDPDTLRTVDGLAVSATAGQYSYRFDNVPPGEYLIYTGTDLDNDLSICDPGEACGAYLTLDQPAVLTVDRDLSGIDFGTGFGVTISTTASATPSPRSVPPLRRIVD